MQRRISGTRQRYSRGRSFTATYYWVRGIGVSRRRDRILGTENTSLTIRKWPQTSHSVLLQDMKWRKNQLRRDLGLKIDFGGNKKTFYIYY